MSLLVEADNKKFYFLGIKRGLVCLQCVDCERTYSRRLASFSFQELVPEGFCCIGKKKWERRKSYFRNLERLKSLGLARVVRCGSCSKTEYRYSGEFYSLQELSQYTGVPIGYTLDAISQGLTIEGAIEDYLLPPEKEIARLSRVYEISEELRRCAEEASTLNDKDDITVWRFEGKLCNLTSPCQDSYSGIIEKEYDALISVIVAGKMVDNNYYDDEDDDLYKPYDY